MGQKAALQLGVQKEEGVGEAVFHAVLAWAAGFMNWTDRLWYVYFNINRFISPTCLFFD